MVVFINFSLRIYTQVCDVEMELPKRAKVLKAADKSFLYVGKCFI